MKPILQLNLQSDNQKAPTANLPNPEREETKPVVLGKRVHRFVNRAAHKAAGEFGKSGSGIFSK